MVAGKRQIQTHWEDNTGTASEAQRGIWKAEKCQRNREEEDSESEGRGGGRMRVSFQNSTNF